MTKRSQREHAKVRINFACNNAIDGGDCYGESYCTSYDKRSKTYVKTCQHEDFMCVSCGCVKICGCCYSLAFRYRICPWCGKATTTDESNQSHIS